MVIIYEDGTPAIVFLMPGSIYLKALLKTPFSMLTTGAYLAWRHFDGNENFVEWKNNWPYQIFTFLLGFTLVFRCNMAYTRFWESRMAIERMTSEWTDAAIKCVAFDIGNEGSDGDLWRQKIISLFSLLHGSGMATIAEEDLEIEVISGVDPDVIRQMNMMLCRDPVYLVYSWLQVELMERLGAGGLKAPPPITTRIWQSMTRGMQGFNDAMAIKDTPFPFPFAQNIALLLWVFGLTCGYIMCMFVSSEFWVMLLTFMAVFGFNSLNEVAKELENPFGDDDNDLELAVYQQCLNSRLQQLTSLGISFCKAPEYSSLFAPANGRHQKQLESEKPNTPRTAQLSQRNICIFGGTQPAPEDQIPVGLPAVSGRFPGALRKIHLFCARFIDVSDFPARSMGTVGQLWVPQTTRED